MLKTVVLAAPTATAEQKGSMLSDHSKFLLKIQNTCTNTVSQQEVELNSMLKNNTAMMKVMKDNTK